MRLFFPVEGHKTRQRTRRIEKQDGVDLEARMVDDRVERELGCYPYYGHRLKIIQAKYDESKPRDLKQFWFDRRKRVEWLGLLIAIVSFVVTAVFTIISAVTGIVQVLQQRAEGS
jgi:hypothetical protein